ncbi:PREDICTED: vicilin-like seed storage protein At2g28490 [Nelumbo nucifera]|uniref:Vicilin-like seed storage protein At2g28490 n=1 Tax=Nelumbo nucifera TaxID=4432 RepID=A0A1U7ZCD6_NELNU|nr:PREDICTED: vicilin-like seed storage protein At2g28490 [Nelumbo nucifera]
MGMSMMKGKATFFLLLLLPVFFSVGYAREEERGERGRGEIFLLQHSKQVFQTDAGQMRVVRGLRTKGVESPMHIGFITMEPNTFFIPQYIDSNLIIFVHEGEGKIGRISHGRQLEEGQLKVGDVYRIPAGSAFYLMNNGKDQRLQIICGIDTSESIQSGLFQSFFIGGGSYPRSVLRGFDQTTLAAAFNVSSSELEDILIGQEGGPIIFVKDADHLDRWTSTWTELLKSEYRHRGVPSTTASYSLYDRKPDFKNNYGWSVAVDEEDFSALRHSGIGVYYVNLTAGSMMAPHVNPTATEYGVVLRGSGLIEVVFPNGTTAMTAEVDEGDVFWVPRYFPFCQTASMIGPMEFFGFTTSARKNRPQFLVGASSILHTMSGPELATAFDVSEERLQKLIDAQRESIILPSTPAVPENTQQQQANNGRRNLGFNYS